MRDMYLQSILVCACLFALATVPLLLHAQTFDQTNTTISVTLNPEFPRPEDRVQVTVDSNLINLNAATVTFYVDGKELEKSNARVAEFIAGPAGKRTTLIVEAVLDGQSYIQEVRINPAEVALIVESLSTVPPFYKGGALIAPEGNIRIVALPLLKSSNGTLIRAEDLVYEWKQGDKQLKDFSGIGRSVLSATAPTLYRGTDVTLTVSDQAQSVVAQTNVSVNPISPYLRIYRSDPLLGVLYNQAIGDEHTLTDTEESFRAIPYYFASSPFLSWTVADQGTSQGQDVTVRRQGDGAGRTNLSVSALDETTSTGATDAFTIIFGRAQNGGLFNFSL